MPEWFKNRLFRQKNLEISKNAVGFTIQNMFAEAEYGRYIEMVSYKEDLCLILRYFSRTEGLILGFLPLTQFSSGELELNIK